MEATLRDLRYAARMLARTPGPTLLAVCVLGLGIGLTATAFSIVNGVVLQNLPFPKAEQLLHLSRNLPARNLPMLQVSPHDFVDWQHEQHAFTGLAAFTFIPATLSDDTGTGRPERYEAAYISPSFLSLLQVQPALGRGFTDEDAVPGATSVALIGYRLWQNRFSGDPGVINRTLRINGQPSTVVGVLPPGFEFPYNQEVWLPLQLDVDSQPRGQGASLEVFGRLRDGVSLQQAQVEMSTLAQKLGQLYPQSNEGVGAVLVPYTAHYIPVQIRGMLLVLFGGVFLVLLLACSNVANLLLGRAARRSREIAIRSALGASRARAVLQLLAESFLLSLSGAVVGMGAAYVCLQLFLRTIADIRAPFWLDLSINSQVLLFTLAVLVVTTLAAGLVPGLRASRADVNEVLRDQTRGGSSLRMGRLSRALVVIEVIASCVLLVGAAVMVRTVLELRQLDLHLNPKQVLTFHASLFADKYPTPEQRAGFFEQLTERLAGRAEVAAAAATSNLPVDNRVQSGSAYTVEGKVYSDTNLPGAALVAATPSFFSTLEIRILDGRPFGPEDRAESQPVVLVSETLARREWPGESCLGKRLRLNGPDQPLRTVVGVVPDLMLNGVNDPRREAIYLPLAQRDSTSAYVVIKTRGEPLAAASAVRQVVAELDPDMPVSWLRTMDQVVREDQSVHAILSGLFTVLGLAALLLAAVGIYGVMAFAATQRTQEMGVRLAFGATPGKILALVTRQGMTLVAIGLAVGLPMGLLLSMGLQAILSGVRQADLTILLLTALFLATVAFVACLAPARRSAAVDPMVALRYE